MSIYADSSFLVSTCLLDAHTVEANRRMRALPNVWISDFNRAEVANAISRYVYRGRIAPSDAQAAWLNFEHDVARGIWITVALPGRVWDRSIDLAWQYGPTFGVRILDSLHVACALELGARRFWTFDDRQVRLAEAVGLETRA